MPGRLTPGQLAAYHRDGFLIVPGVFSAGVADAALRAVDMAMYGHSFEDWQAAHEAGGAPDAKDGVIHAAVNGEGLPVGERSQFPTGVRALDKLIEHEPYLDLLEELLGHEVRYCNAHLFTRAGAIDKRHPLAGPWSAEAASAAWDGFHIDHGTNSRLPPSQDYQRFGYVNSAVYLHDVGEDCAPMLVVPGSHAQAPAIFAAAMAEGRDLGKDLRACTGVTPVPAVGSKGAALFYSSYLIHAAQPFANKRCQRSFWTLSVTRADTAYYNKLSNPWEGPDQAYMQAWAKEASSRALCLFDTPAAARARAEHPQIPPPGHPFFTQQTLGLMEKWCPELELAPYRDGINGSVHPPSSSKL